MLDPLAALAEAGFRWIPPLVLLWLAVFFGRTLRGGSMPLIERIARRGQADLPAALCRYTRRLTLLWCVCFAAAAVASVVWARVGPLVWVGAVVLFVGERWVRPWIFPGEVFPGLAQQLRDTWSVWRARG